MGLFFLRTSRLQLQCAAAEEFLYFFWLNGCSRPRIVPLLLCWSSDVLLLCALFLIYFRWAIFALKPREEARHFELKVRSWVVDFLDAMHSTRRGFCCTNIILLSRCAPRTYAGKLVGRLS